MARGAGEARHGVELSNLDDELFEGAGVAKRALVDHLEAVADRMIPELRDRPLSVIRTTGHQAPFMQKNLPKHAPAWIERAPLWAEASHRTVEYALCNDVRTLLWFANQRAVEYHPTLVRAGALDRPTHLVIDLDPPSGDDFAAVVRAARLVHEVLTEVGLAGAVKTSGSKGLHIVVPVDGATGEDAAAATRAIAARAARIDPAVVTTAFLKADRGGKVFLDATRTGGATVVAVYSPRVRPGATVSFPVAWDDLDAVRPTDFTISNAAALLGDRDLWAASLPAPQRLDDGPAAVLVEEGHGIPIPRAAAMHEGKRRKRAAGGDRPARGGR